MYKVGLVVEGGGMRGIYGAGVLDRFLDEGFSFPYCIGVSAGSANLVSFLSKQKGRNYRYFKFHAKNEKYMSFKNMLKNGSFFGLDYIYETLTSYLDAVDYEALSRTASSLKIAVTSAETAETAYFSGSDLKLDDYKVLMATCAVPILNKPVTIEGREYFDGGTTDPIPVLKALEDGCEKLVVVLSRMRGFVKPPERMQSLSKKLLVKYPNIAQALRVRHTLYNETLMKVAELEREGRAIVIAPSQDVKMSMFGNDDILIDRLYSSAISDADENKDRIREFVFGN